MKKDKGRKRRSEIIKRRRKKNKNEKDGINSDKRERRKRGIVTLPI